MCRTIAVLPVRRIAGPGLALILACFLIAASCAPASSQPGEIRLGEINPLTGRLAAQGTAVHDGIIYAVDEANARGGVKGRKIVLISRDDESKPERAIAAAEELTSKEKVLALVGGYVDSLVGPISEVAERNGVPYLATASLHEALSQRGYRYFFRMSNLPPYVNAITGIVLDELRAEKVAIIHSNTPGATQLAQRQREVLEAAGVEVTVFESFSTGISDFTPMLTKVRESGTEVILLNGFFTDNLLMIRQLKEHGITVKGFLGAFGMEFPALIEQLGPAAEGMMGTTGWQPGITMPGTEEASQAYVSGFTEKYGHPPAPLSMHGYAATRALLHAAEAVLDKGLPLTSDNVRDALADIDLLLPLERLRFDANGDPMGYERVIIQIQNGKHVVVYPPQRATGKVVYPLPK